MPAADVAVSRRMTNLLTELAPNEGYTLSALDGVGFYPVSTDGLIKA